MSKLDHTNVATWEASDGNKTITNCIVGKPVLFIHKVRGSGTNNFGWCYIKPTAGCYHAAANSQHHYIIGSGSWDEYQAGCTNIFIVVPNTTSITVNIASTADDIIYCFQ